MYFLRRLYYYDEFKKEVKPGSIWRKYGDICRTLKTSFNRADTDPEIFQKGKCLIKVKFFGKIVH